MIFSSGLFVTRASSFLGYCVFSHSLFVVSPVRQWWRSPPKCDVNSAGGHRDEYSTFEIIAMKLLTIHSFARFAYSHFEYRSWLYRMVAFLLIIVSALESSAGDWPQILGPHRDGVASDEMLADRWPYSGPKLLWESKIGSGYAGPAVADRRVIIFHRIGNNERIESLDADTGEELWNVDWEATYGGGVNADKGPRCVPLIHKSSTVIAFGAAGRVYCVDFDSGAEIWTRDLYGDYRGDEGYFGAGSAPIVVDDIVLINVGGRSDAGIVALSIQDGTTIWTATRAGASYSSPVKMPHGANQRVVFVTRLGTFLIDATTGEVLDSLPFGKRGPTVNAAMPLVIGDHMFLTASYGIGAAWLQISNRQMKVRWQKSEVLSSQYNSCIYHEGKLYGIHGREDVGRAELRCIDAKSGTVLWRETGFGVAHLILANDQILALKSNGQLVHLKANPERFELIQKGQVFENTTRALPALANGKFYARSNHRNDQLRCFDIGAGTK